MLRKIFGGFKMTWLRLILFAVISGVVTALIALLVPADSSFHQIAETFEAWIVLAIIVVVNCDKPVEAACKTFVYFLISQPLVYLIQVPFSSLGFGLFKYYPYWFYWTVATLPGAFIAWFIKRDDWIAALILSVALAALIFLGGGYLRTLIDNPPRHLAATLFCFGSAPLLIFAILHQRTPRLIAGGIAAAALAAVIVYVAGGWGKPTFSCSFGLDEKRFPVTDEWSVRLEDPDNGTASLYVGHDVIGSTITVSVKDVNQPAGVILTDPDGREYFFPAKVIKDGNGLKIVQYDEPDDGSPADSGRYVNPGLPQSGRAGLSGSPAAGGGAPV